MEKYNVQFKKRFGQNFLKDVSIVQRMVSSSGVDSSSLVLEVGPGGAILTKELAKVAKHVLAYEIDVDLKEELETRLATVSNVTILFQDFLDSDIMSDISKYTYEKLFFISNVPYYITTPILMKLLESNLTFSKIMMMVQKEVGDRFSATPGSKEYGAITVLLQYYYDIHKEFFVSRNQFVPKPNVDSVVISFTPKEHSIFVNDFSFFHKLVKDSFQFKRKNIKNNLKNYDLDVIESILSEYGYDLTVRAEALSLEIFISLANALSK